MVAFLETRKGLLLLNKVSAIVVQNKDSGRADMER